MATKWPRHFVIRPSGFYFQATPKMRAAGIMSESLGKDMVSAAPRAELLNASWDDIRRGLEPVGKPPARPGTFCHLIVTLRGSAEWRDKQPSTVAELEYAIGIIEPVFGDSDLKAISPEACRSFYDALREKSSIHKAARVAKWLRYLLGFAWNQGYITNNPARSFRIKHPESRGQIWTAGQISTVIANAQTSGRPCIALATQVAYNTALRQGDILALTWGQFKNDRLLVKQKKTGKDISCPLSDATIKMLKAQRGDVIPLPLAPIIRGPHGRPYLKDNFTHRFRDICKAAGIPAELQFRDIRRTTATELAEAGATAPEIAAVTGHSIGSAQRILDTYVKKSHDMAASAQAKRDKKGPKV